MSSQKNGLLDQLDNLSRKLNQNGGVRERSLALQRAFLKRNLDQRIGKARGWGFESPTVHF